MISTTGRRAGAPVVFIADIKPRFFLLGKRGFFFFATRKLRKRIVAHALIKSRH